MDIGDKIKLPRIEFILRVPAGRVRHVIREPIELELVSQEDMRVSPRRRLPRYVLSNGERIFILDRKLAELPADADGVLLLAPGKAIWLRHVALEQFQARWDVDHAAIRDQIRTSWNDSFRIGNPTSSEAPPDGTKRLRPPQAGALCAIAAHWSLALGPATVVMPTGTGKTETILAAFTGLMRGTALMVVPSDSLRRQTADKFLNLGLLRELRVLAEDSPNPIVGILHKRPRSADDLSFIKNCDVVVTTISCIAQGSAEPLGADIASLCETLVLDEAHHVAANTWAGLRDNFKGKRILQFTATPFRRDGEVVDGKVIYNYPLRKAQEDGYFKQIRFVPIRENDTSEADRAVAGKAVEQLRQDLSAELDHILMARCDSIERAKAVLPLYEKIAADLSPVVVHSKEANPPEVIARLKRRDSRIIVCVDMLGEGFDLPQLKIAAIHDTHKSLSVVLQFTGRFTREAGPAVGNATLVANIADHKVAHALERLYSEDADWNSLLAEFSFSAVSEHMELVEFLRNTERVDQPEEDDPTQGLGLKSFRPKFSTLVYSSDSFHPKRFKKAFPDREKVAGVWVNEKSNLLAIVQRSESPAGWTRTKALIDRIWDLVIVFYDEDSKLLFVASSDRDANCLELARAVGSGQVQQLTGDRMFRSLGRVSRLLLQIVGLKKHGSGKRALSFSMYTGMDVAAALGAAQKASSTKSNVSGSGYEHGAPTTVGCSYKGRVWSREQGHVTEFMRWAKHVGQKLIDATISTDDIIAHLMVPRVVGEFPDKVVLCLDWPREFLGQPDEKVRLLRDDEEVALSEFSPERGDISADRRTMEFRVVSLESNTTYSFEIKSGGGFEIKHKSGPVLRIQRSRGEQPLDEWFSDFPPSVLYVDGSELEGDTLVEPSESSIAPLPPDQLLPWKWTGVDLTTESIWKAGIRRSNSIQGHVFDKMKIEGFDVIVDDDGRGEAADLVCIAEKSDYIQVRLVHCKFSGSDDVGMRVKDVVEVCSQAVRSSRWNWRFGHLCTHLQNRDARRKRRSGTPRFLVGDAKVLRKLASLSRFKEPRFEIFVVQPGVSKSNLSDDQQIILSGANSFLLDTIRTRLDVICSE